MARLEHSLTFDDKNETVIYAPCEDRTHDLQIMRLTRCLLR